MNRSDFLKSATLASLGLATGIGHLAAAPAPSPTPAANPWKMRFAPHVGLTSPDDFMFPTMAAKDPVEQIKFLANLGFARMAAHVRPGAHWSRAGASQYGDGLLCGYSGV